MDFGEQLADIRQQLDQPLPIRVRAAPLFARVALEAFCTPLLRLAHRRYAFTGDKPRTLLDFFGHAQTELDQLSAAFSVLNRNDATPEQIHQAQSYFNFQVFRRHERLATEWQMEGAIMQSASFLGVTLYLLMLLNIILLGWFDKLWTMRTIIVFAIMEVAALLVCESRFFR